MKDPKLFPCYTGGKARWVSRLDRFAGRRFVEPFAGSAAISFALGADAWWNDLDPALTTILARFPEQEVPEVFTLEDYAAAARRPDWWRFAFVLSRMAYAGLFRYSARSGFNVSPDRRIPELRLRPEFEAALARWNALDPVVTCGEWTEVPDEVFRDAVVILDPPFEGSHTPYNRVGDYAAFWRRAEELPEVAEAVIVFGYAEDLGRRFPEREIATRKMRPNGKRPGQVEGMVILERAA